MLHSHADYAPTPEEETIGEELNDRIQKAIGKLPEQRKKAFVYSRYHDLTYREISEKMEVSIKTVEKQIGAALRFLRDDLKDYLPLLIVALLLLFILNE